MSGMRISIEAREKGQVHRIELDAQSDNWLDEARNDRERRAGVVAAANGLLRSLNLPEIAETADV